MRSATVAALLLLLLLVGCGTASNGGPAGSGSSLRTAASRAPAAVCALDRLVAANARAQARVDPDSQIGRMYASGNQILADTYGSLAARDFAPIAERLGRAQGSFVRALRRLPRASGIGNLGGDVEVLVVLEQRVSNDLRRVASKLRRLRGSTSSAIRTAEAVDLYGTDVSDADQLLTELGVPGTGHAATCR